MSNDLEQKRLIKMIFTEVRPSVDIGWFEESDLSKNSEACRSLMTARAGDAIVYRKRWLEDDGCRRITMTIWRSSQTKNAFHKSTRPWYEEYTELRDQYYQINNVRYWSEMDGVTENEFTEYFSK